MLAIMRRAVSFAVIAIALSLWLVSLYRPSTVQSQTGEPALQFRIVVGQTDSEPKTFKGAVTVTGGALDALSGWRFSGDDAAEPSGKFEFVTKVGPLENQLSARNPYGQTGWDDPGNRRLIPQGLLVRVNGGSPRVRFDAGPFSFEFAAGDVPFGKPLAVLGGNGKVERMPVETKLSEAGSADDYPALAFAPDGSEWTAWLSYRDRADRVLARGAGKTHELTGPGDHHSPTLAAGKGRVWAAWSQNEGGTFHLYARMFSGGSWSKPEKLTSTGGSNLWPRLAGDGANRAALVWMGFRDNRAVVLGRQWDGSKWSAETRLSEGGNAWAPSVAFGGGKLWAAWDSYATGSYQIYAREWTSGAIQRVTKGESFSVRPSVAVTREGRPIVAWEESDAAWGKDFAFLTDRRGTTLYKNRRVRVAYQDGPEWKELPPVAESVDTAVRRFVQQPQLALDDEGRLYLGFRCRTSAANSRVDYWASNGRWETFLTHLDGERWTGAAPMPASIGRNGMASAIAVHGGRVRVVWAADNRPWPAVRLGDLDVFAASVPVEGTPARLAGSAIAAASATGENAHPGEAADTQRIRQYRVSINGRQYRIVRGDLHRHTELSNDGAGDGSLDDLYRYFLDAASMDYAHVADHQMGNDEEYNWWITQKSNDLYYMPRRFVPMYGYERSVRWPNGHRNVVWAERGKPVLRIGQPEQKGGANSGPILYPYLRDTKGMATSHSPATEQGTDWRDNDPDLEPLVEIYQGFESSYEFEGAPRAWKKGEATIHQGLRPLGYVWNAWAKGYKMGVQSSSDHVSTHASYACFLVEDFTRQGLLDAMRKRHAYAATDQIILDYRIETPEGAALMGDIVKTASQPKLVVKVIGTAPVKQIDVIKNNAYIHKLTPNRREVSFEYADIAPAAGESYYYVRVEQADGQLAWSSPIWVRR